jgi:hypothetical protein
VPQTGPAWIIGDDGYFAAILPVLSVVTAGDPQFEMDDAARGRHRLWHHSAVELSGLVGHALGQPT